MWVSDPNVGSLAVVMYGNPLSGGNKNCISGWRSPRISKHVRVGGLGGREWGVNPHTQ